MWRSGWANVETRRQIRRLWKYFKWARMVVWSTGVVELKRARWAQDMFGKENQWDLPMKGCEDWRKKKEESRNTPKTSACANMKIILSFTQMGKSGEEQVAERSWRPVVHTLRLKCLLDILGSRSRRLLATDLEFKEDVQAGAGGIWESLTFGFRFKRMPLCSAVEMILN